MGLFGIVWRSRFESAVQRIRYGNPVVRRAWAPYSIAFSLSHSFESAVTSSRQHFQCFQCVTVTVSVCSQKSV
eukprot:scaffold7567_cov104-Isochrysis_galbana.AAC.7